METIEIKRMEGLRGLKAFVQFHYDMYRDCPQAVPFLFSEEMNTLRSDRNAAFECCEAEYFMAMFSLDAPAGLSTRGVYLVGDLTSQVLDETTRMEYDPNAGLYFKELLLKEGAYNYQYLVPVRMQETETGEEKPLLSTSFVEGNHYETPNEYEIFVYYCPFGRRYDRLVGTAKIY